MIEIDGDSGEQYKVPSRRNYADPKVDEVVLAEGNEVEIFYGRRSKIIVLANVIAKNDDKVKRDITELFGPKI